MHQPSRLVVAYTVAGLNELIPVHDTDVLHFCTSCCSSLVIKSRAIMTSTEPEGATTSTDVPENVAAAIASQIQGVSKPRVRRLADIMDDGVLSIL